MTDRDRVNIAIEASPYNCCLPVSEEHVDEMRDCVPPQTMRRDDYYQTIQVGEISRHDSQGTPRYETYQMMSQRAITDQLADARMEPNQWYFTGLKR